MLTVNQLVGFSADYTPKILTLHTSTNSTSDLTTYTFAGQAIGAAAPDRLVIVGCGGGNSSNARTLASATIGGIAASIVVQATGGTGQCCAIIIALVPTGTTADVVLTFSGGCQRASIGVWTATGLLSAAAFHTGSSTASPGTATLNTLADGFAIGYIALENTATFTWTNLTEQFDTTNAEGTSYSGAHARPTAAGTLAVEGAYSAADTRRAMVVASW